MVKKWLTLVIFAVLTWGSAQTYVELVLDASGSMWNKLGDGTYRIVAAKEVLADFVSSLPADESLNVGLRVYGSTLPALVEGACEDSELFVPLEGIARNRLLETVRDTNAVGATPIAYSLEQAAQDLPAEGRRLIVLVTDGEESCGGDVRGTLETLRAQGIEFELNIIGFDLDARAIESFEGLGTFENATSAGELAAALGRAVAVEETTLYPVTVTLTRSGEPAADGARVDFVEVVSGERYSFGGGDPGTFTADLPAGAYEAEVADAFSSAPLSFGGLSVTPEAGNAFTFELAEETGVTLSVTPSDPLTGSTVTVTFEGAPAGEGDWITLVPADVPDTVYLDWSYVTGASGAVELRIPAEVTALEARYHLELPGGGTRVIGRSEPISPVQATATINVPAEVAAGTEFEVTWTGPDNDRDYLTLVPSDAEEGSYAQYRYTREGSTLRFTAPIEAGNYELRYQSDGTTGLIARAPLTVIGSEITLEVPAEVEAGKPFEIMWTGPGGNQDYLTVVPAAASDGTYNQYRYTRDGSSLSFTAPIEPGQYEVRYQSDREGGVFARQAFTVVGTDISLEVPDSVAAGSGFEVAWVGPDGPQDYITVVPAGAAAGSYTAYKYTREGTPLMLTAPIEPGDYEVRYQSDRESGVVFASVPLTVTGLEIVLNAPAEVTAGETFEVAWEGPDGAQDYITIVPAGAAEGTYLSYAYTSSGSPLTLNAPDEPGAYEIRYSTDRGGAAGKVFASVPITVK